MINYYHPRVLSGYLILFIILTMKSPSFLDKFTKTPILFWQPSRNFFSHFASTASVRRLLLVSNYIIWLFFFYLSFLLVKVNPNNFWQIFLAVLTSEIIEKYLKIKCLWRRPLCLQINQLPRGFLRSWYQNGSFPSGHTIKAAFFLLFILQYGVFSPWLFLFFTAPLLIFRILTGFHYPADVFGGTIFGIIIWFVVKGLQFPPFLLNFTRIIFNTIFLIH